MSSDSNGSSARIEFSHDQSTMHLLGDWTLPELSGLESKLEEYTRKAAENVCVDGGGIHAMDTAGALILNSCIHLLHSEGKKITMSGVNDRFKSLLDLVTRQSQALHELAPPEEKPNLLAQLGKWTYDKWLICVGFLSFVGEIIASAFETIWRPRGIQAILTLRNVDEVGYRALPIVALLIFLVGVVLTYQIALQMESYNAKIFIVDITGMVILREFGPLITAIIAAGRTSTAFTAQIGAMKVNQEIDALETLGVSPIRRLALPKVLALLIALPLLSVWADIFGILGCMVMSKVQLGIAYHVFLERFQNVIAYRHYLVGLVKTPVFAFIIATVGCFQGFQVEPSADSVGKKTTQSAVQSIFLIIIVDAIFSIILSWRDI